MEVRYLSYKVIVGFVFNLVFNPGLNATIIFLLIRSLVMVFLICHWLLETENSCADVSYQVELLCNHTVIMPLWIHICSFSQGKWLSIARILDSGEMKTDACVSTELFCF